MTDVTHILTEDELLERASRLKMVAIDLDDTLLRNNNTVSSYTQEIIRKVEAKGLRVLIATGRMYQTAHPVGKALALGDVPMVLFSGASIQKVESGTFLYSNPIPQETLTELLQLAKVKQWYIQGYVDDELWVHHETPESRAYEKGVGAKAVYVGEQLYEMQGEVLKVLHIAEPETIERTQAFLQTHFGNRLELVRSKPTFLEIIAPGCSKGSAVVHMGKQWGVEPEEIVAFGNSENDISMLKTCGLGIAVANAEENVKAIAQGLCDSNEADGVAKWLAAYVLREG